MYYFFIYCVIISCKLQVIVFFSYRMSNMDLSVYNRHLPGLQIVLSKVRIVILLVHLIFWVDSRNRCCRCLPCNHCSNWTWVVEEILAFGTRLRSTHCSEFYYLKLCRIPCLYFENWNWTHVCAPGVHVHNAGYSEMVKTFEFVATKNPSRPLTLMVLR